MPELGRRELTRRRKIRERREALVVAEREWVCGGPLIDIAKPIIGGGDTAHPLLVQEEIARRTRIWTREAELLARHFARKCWVTLSVQERMDADYERIIAEAGPPALKPTHSTRPGVTPTTIPRLETTDA